MLRLNKIYVKRPRVGPYGIAAIALIGLAVLVRLILVASGWPQTDSDEGTMGLEAMHIALRGEHPIFLYGQNYMGVIEAYIAALPFRLFGVSLFNLRLGMIMLFALFLVSLYLLSSLIYDKKLALISLAFLSIGARNILMPEIRAVGGAAETLLCGTLLMLLAAWLALTAGPDQLPRRRRWRLVAYTGWGLAAGLGLWSHLLVSPFILTSGLILLFFCWRDLRSRAALWLVAGLLIGAMPMIYYNVIVPADQNSLAAALQIHNAGNIGVPLSQAPYIKRLSGTLIFSLPTATGINPICNLHEMPLFGPATANTLACTLVDGGWSLGYLALMIVSISLAVFPLLRLWRLRLCCKQTWRAEERQASIIHFTRLMLLCSVGITLVLFAISPLAAEKPWSTRYLIGLLTATPAVLWPIWHGLRSVKSPSINHHSPCLKNIFRNGILMLMGVIFLTGFVSVLTNVQRDISSNQSNIRLAHDLEHMGIKHVYSGYWDCDLLGFASQEQVICSVVDMKLKAGLNRYLPYHAIVSADANASYMFPLGSDLAQAAVKSALLSSQHYHQFVLDGYVIYEPGAP